MLAAAVTGVDYRHGRVFRGHARGTIERMTHDDEVGVGRNHADGVGEALALGGGTRMHVGGTDDRAAEPMHRGLEAEAGPR
jgi:hypothetical protein